MKKCLLFLSILTAIGYTHASTTKPSTKTLQIQKKKETTKIKVDLPIPFESTYALNALPMPGGKELLALPFLCKIVSNKQGNYRCTATYPDDLKAILNDCNTTWTKFHIDMSRDFANLGLKTLPLTEVKIYEGNKNNDSGTFYTFPSFLSLQEKEPKTYIVNKECNLHLGKQGSFQDSFFSNVKHNKNDIWTRIFRPLVNDLAILVTKGYLHLLEQVWIDSIAIVTEQHDPFLSYTIRWFDMPFLKPRQTTPTDTTTNPYYIHSLRNRVLLIIKKVLRYQQNYDTIKQKLQQNITDKQELKQKITTYLEQKIMTDSTEPLSEEYKKLALELAHTLYPQTIPIKGITKKNYTNKIHKKNIKARHTFLSEIKQYKLLPERKKIKNEDKNKKSAPDEYETIDKLLHPEKYTNTGGGNANKKNTSKKNIGDNVNPAQKDTGGGNDPTPTSPDTGKDSDKDHTEDGNANKKNTSKKNIGDNVPPAQKDTGGGNDPTPTSPDTGKDSDKDHTGAIIGVIGITAVVALISITIWVRSSKKKKATKETALP